MEVLDLDLGRGLTAGRDRGRGLDPTPRHVVPRVITLHEGTAHAIATRAVIAVVAHDPGPTLRVDLTTGEATLDLLEAARPPLPPTDSVAPDLGVVRGPPREVTEGAVGADDIGATMVEDHLLDTGGLP